MIKEISKRSGNANIKFDSDKKNQRITDVPIIINGSLSSKTVKF